MVDEKLIKTKRLKLTTAIYYKKLLEYIPDNWNFDITLNKKAKNLTEIEIERLLIVKKYYDIVVSLSQIIDIMTARKVNEMQIDIHTYMQIISFNKEEIKKFKFGNNTEYLNFLKNEGIDAQDMSILNENSSIYSNENNSSGIKAKSHYKNHFHKGRRY